MRFLRFDANYSGVLKNEQELFEQRSVFSVEGKIYAKHLEARKIRLY